MDSEYNWEFATRFFFCSSDQSKEFFVKFRASQELRGEILARTLDSPRPRSYTPEGTIATQMVERFKETGHPEFKSISVLSRGIFKRKGGRYTIHFNADVSNTEIFFSHNSRSKISSVSAEQSLAGVKSSLNGFRIRKSRCSEKFVGQKKMSSC